jgi:hypothetical protein
MKNEGLQIIFQHQKQRSKEENMNRGKKTNDILFQIFFKKNSKPFLVLNPVSFSFQICFKWSKNLWVCQLRI